MLVCPGVDADSKQRSRQHRMQTVSVVICAFSEDRLGDLSAAVESVRRQPVQVLETIVVVDHNPLLLDLARRAFADVRVVANARVRGASGGRNTGAELARGEILAFLDDDARAAETWLEALIEPFGNPAVAGVGGAAHPVWPTRRPSWFPPEFDWIIGCSYQGLPTACGPVRNLIGANMSVRREVMLGVGGFLEGFGNIATNESERRRLSRASTCEETEFCLRVLRERPGMQWIYCPTAAVFHRVTAQRTSLGYFVARCWVEGRGKSTLAGIAGQGRALAAERRYVSRTLPLGVARGMADAVRHADAAALARAGCIVMGLAVTIASYAWHCVRDHAWRASAGAGPVGHVRSLMDSDAGNRDRDG